MTTDPILRWLKFVAIVCVAMFASITAAGIYQWRHDLSVEEQLKAVKEQLRAAQVVTRELTSARADQLERNKAQSQFNQLVIDMFKEKK